ncbi:MAG TPA: DUF2235 domain-containing protein [Terriglobales bacterium]|nr:DUF2235 domain-containing protein [Terriglobales bacterium]
MTAQSPDPFPTDGLRELSPREAMQRVAALACTLPKDCEPACTGQVNVGIFFDGTGNNRLEDYIGITAEAQREAMKSGSAPRAPETPLDRNKQKHSNVVRLFHAYRNDLDNGFAPFYIPGVGTPFAEIGDKGGTSGSAFGAGGQARILWAFTRLMNAPYAYAQGIDFLDTAASKELASTSASHEDIILSIKERQDRLQAALRGKKPQITEINLSVFGFSRGAAEARAFTNWLFESCTQEDGAWLFAGIPLRVFFLGIFDTVAAVGLGNTTGNDMFWGHQGWGNFMEIHPAIEQCVHFVAGHEVRGSFSLDTARIGDDYPPNVKEVMYPGAHSDVGGGYKPGALGVSPTQGDIMATVAGANMYLEARLAGVPLLAKDELPEDDREDLTPSVTVINDLNAYLQAANITLGRVEDMHRQHMSLYHSYRFKYRATYRDRPWYQAAEGEEKEGLDTTSKGLMDRLQAFWHHVPVKDPAYDPKEAKDGYAHIYGPAKAPPMQQLYSVAENINVDRLSPEIERLFDNYVHDSVAGFAAAGVNEPGINSMGIMRFRTIFDRN